MTTPHDTERLVIQRVQQMQDYRGTTDSHLMAAAGIRTYATWRARMAGKHSFTIAELVAITETLGFKLADLSDPDFTLPSLAVAS